MTDTALHDAGERVRARHVELTATLAAISARQFEGTDPSRLVRASVDGHGAFADVKISAPLLHDASPEELATAVIAALSAARQTLATELQATMGGVPADLVDRARSVDLSPVDPSPSDLSSNDLSSNDQPARAGLTVAAANGVGA